MGKVSTKLSPRQNRRGNRSNKLLHPTTNYLVSLKSAICKSDWVRTQTFQRNFGVMQVFHVPGVMCQSSVQQTV